MNKRVWLFSLLITLFVFCIQTSDARAEDKAPQESVGLSELVATENFTVDHTGMQHKNA